MEHRLGDTEDESETLQSARTTLYQEIYTITKTGDDTTYISITTINITASSNIQNVSQTNPPASATSLVDEKTSGSTSILLEVYRYPNHLLLMNVISLLSIFTSLNFG